MTIETIELKCPNCGASVSVNTTRCEYCNSPIVIRTVNNFQTPSDAVSNSSSVSLPSAYNFLKLKLYDKALLAYEAAIKENFNNSDAHFFAAISLLKGKRPFLVSTASIKKAEEYLQTAIAIEPKGIYYYFWSYIRFDHYHKKFFKASPDYKELLSLSTKAGLSSADVKDLYDILDVEKPSEL